MKRLIPAVAIILGWASAAWTTPVTRAHEASVTPPDKRARVHGTITYYQPGRAVVLQNESRSFWIATATTSSDLRINDSADATGVPVTQAGLLTLTDGEIRDDKVPATVAAQPAIWKQLASGAYAFDLISIEGQVVTEAREALEDEYILSSGEGLFTVIYSHVNGISQPMNQFPRGSRVRVTGICVPENFDPFRSQSPFEILLRYPDDITVISKPPLLAERNYGAVTGFLFLGLVALAFWGWRLKNKLRSQAGKLATMAYLEQRRGRILADINSAKPLAEILEAITETITFMLDGAPCWCEVKDGAKLGKHPPDETSLQILREEIPSRSGPPQGVLFVGLDAKAFPGVHRSFSHEMELLSGGAKLAMLAMETRRLYSDLLHRSEVDQLTNIYNRRSLGERMDALIEETRQNASVFGLIYIDLDRFKPINDRYGHHVGDLFLQEVANRMKKQLRSHDLLARLGGDEFAALLPMVRNRTRIEEIALRLEHCFKEPFVVEGYVLNGSASFGYAIYPEDGATKEALLSSADAAMYEAKNFKKKVEARSAGREESRSDDRDRESER